MTRATETDPRRVEQEARALFAELDAPPPVVRDEAGRPVEVSHGARLVEIERRARLIAVSDGLARAVVALLRGHGVTAEVEHVRVDPAAEADVPPAAADEQVVAVRATLAGTAVVVPVRPGALVVRAYPAVGGIRLDGAPLFTAALPGTARERDGWVGAGAFATALREHLS